MGSGADPRGSVATRVSVQGRANYSKPTFAAIDQIIAFGKSWSGFSNVMLSADTFVDRKSVVPPPLGIAV